MTHAKKKLSKIILRKLKNFLDKLLGDYADELYWKYIHLLRKDYLKIFQNNEKQPHRQILINKILKNNNIKKVLELGCGDGVNLRILAKKNRSINLYGIDINKKAIQLGIEKINNFNFNIKLICSKIQNIQKYKNNEFDVVFTDAALMYFDFRNVCKILNQVFRIARSKVFICEQHTDGKHFYNGKWVHNYKKILYKIKEGGGMVI